jgi:hypothetical protein
MMFCMPMQDISDPKVTTRPEWCDAKSVRAIFGVSRTTLYRLADAGRIRTSSLRERGKLRGKRLFSYDSVAAFIEANATGGGAP